MKSRKTVLYVIVSLVVIIVCVVAALISSGRSISDLTGHQTYVKDVVTGESIPNVTLSFTFADYCHSEDILRSNYDYSTCEGRYSPIKPVTSNEDGLVSPEISLVEHPPASAIRYYVTESEGYHPTRSYGLTYHDTVWLVPLDAPLESKPSAIEFIDEQKPVQELFRFYESKQMSLDYLYEEKEAWYGVWRVTINVNSPRIIDGVITDTLNNHKHIVILVHPGTKEYIICNPVLNDNYVSSSIRQLNLAEGEESDFSKNLDNSYTYNRNVSDCDANLLLES